MSPGTAADQLEPDPLEIAFRIGIGDAVSAKRFPGGSSTTVWRIDTGRSRYGLRLYGPGDTARLDRELTGMDHAERAGVPVAEQRQQFTYMDRPVLLYSWVDGESLWDLITRSPDRTASIGREFGRVQAAIHQSVSAGGDGRHPRWIEALGPEEERLRTLLYKVASETRSLLHMDYHQLNVIANEDRISGVIDWTNSQFGDPRADVARTVAMLTVEPYVPGREENSLTELRRALHDAWRTGYEEVAGPVAGMAPFYAWAGAYMQRDLAHRVTDPSSWWTDDHMARVGRWTDQWKRECGL
jgi:aminoglycoside phosphotransferase (APT) family kinase protein